MKNRLRILIRYAIFWLIFFELSRVIFLLYNYTFTCKLSFLTILQTFGYGFQHDISLIGYIVAITSLILITSIFTLSKNSLQIIFNSLTLILLIPASLITFADAELYRNWGYRMDCSALQYLAMPKEALGSIPFWQLLLLLLAVAILTILFYKLYVIFIQKHLNNLEKTSYGYTAIFLIIIALQVIPIRGGIGVATLRTGSVYFCSQAFANHAAINDHWHFLYSFGYNKREVATNFMNDEECNAIFDSLFTSGGKVPEQLVSINRPNILLFILESFTASQMKILGGNQDITPHLDSIARQGVLFSNCFANGTKSEMGIVSVLSGYPAQPKTAIIKYTEKMEKLPYLSQLFDSLGYNLSLYHGGDIHFGNMNSYFLNGGFKKCITRDNFSNKDCNSKWGAYDHVVLQKLFEDLHNEREPFFSVCYTLSSHEPFEVPMKSEFYDENEYSKFLNSVHYADSCLGDFMHKAKNESWWQNTLVIFISDHGARIPHNIANSDSTKFHIPFILSGGVIKKDTVIQEVMSQCDLPKIICNQLYLPSNNFTFSRDILSGDTPFAFYTFNNGCGYIRDNQHFTWDNESSKIITQSSNLQDTTLKQGQALLQKVMTDFCKK